MEKSIVFNNREENNREEYLNMREVVPAQPRDYQIYAKETLEWEVVDLLQDEDIQGHRLLSRADLILIFSLYNKSGLEGFLNEYLKYAEGFIERYGENAIIKKPHHYLKQLIG